MTRMLPNVRYATTSDGTQVAFQLIGSGPPLLFLFPYHVSHLELNWRVPLHRGAMEFFARSFSVINLDLRGAGLSQRPAAISLDRFVADVHAVLDEIAAGRAAICAVAYGALVAFRVLRSAPERFASLVLVQSGDSKVNAHVLSLRKINVAVEARTRGALLGVDRANAEALAAVAEKALDVDALTQWEQILSATTLLSEAHGIDIPTMALHAEDDELVSRSAARALVSALPKAQLISVPGRSGMEVWRARPALQSVVRFIDENFGSRGDRPRRRVLPRRTDLPAGLSRRELEVLCLLADGKSNQQISDTLFISLNTVSYHLRNIFAKTAAANRTEAVSFAFRHRLA